MMKKAIVFENTSKNISKTYLQIGNYML